jgi:arylsulfatase A-like enzyme
MTEHSVRRPQNQRSVARPPVIVFLTDQQRWDTAGCGGNPEGLTPNLDHAARSGTWFDNAHTPQPLCTPARSCLQTGRFATTNGVYRNGISLAEDADTLAKRFGDAGYATGYIGKWHLADTSSRGPVRPEQRGGYQTWLAANAVEHTSDSYATRLWNEDQEPVELPGYRVDALTDAAIRYINDHADEPFFLFLSFLEPHHQNHRDDYPAPEVYQNSYHGRWLPPDLASLHGTAYQQIGGYYGMIKRLDEAFGRVLDALRSLGLYDQSVVVFSSDHGNHFKTRNGEYKRSVHDASTRVPLLIRGPQVPRGRLVEDVVSTVGLPATLLELAGVAAPEGIQPSLTAAMRSVEPPAGEAFIQVSETEVARAVRTQRWKYGVVAPDADPIADAGSDRYTEAYLYDLEADPYELTNLVGLPSHRAVSDHLRERLLAWMTIAGEAEPVIEPAVREQGGFGQREIHPAEVYS